MKKDTSNDSSGLGPEMAAYLRGRRTTSNLTQAAISERGRKLGIKFDESWVSQWERKGPKEGFIKALAYLDLIDADLALLSEMARAKVHWPDEPASCVSDALRRCLSLSLEGQSAAALGVALSALRTGRASREESVRLHLMASILARKADLLALAAHFAHCAEEDAAGAAIDPLLAAKLAVELSSVAVERGEYGQAESHLDAISQDALENDPFIRACERHARGYLLQECRDARSAIDLFEQALTQYPGEYGPSVTPCLLVLIGLNRAQLGQESAARRALESALEISRRNELPLVEQHVQYHAGRAFTLLGRYKKALALLTSAEAAAEKLGRPLRLFEVRLALYDLAERCDDRALSGLLRRRLMIDRPLLTLTHRQKREYDELFGLI